MNERNNNKFTTLNWNEQPNTVEELDLLLLKISELLYLKTKRVIPKWRSTIHNILCRKVMVTNLNIEIPFGPLFYPCSGSDTQEVFQLFNGSVSQYHFSDPFKYLQNKNTVKEEPTTTIEIPHIGNIVSSIKNYTFVENNENKIQMHRKDGLLTLIDDLPEISVFFYRGDSPGEGGSGQYWQLPVLLDQVLSKILDGGLICTDESNSGGFIFEKMKNLSFTDSFFYKNLYLKKVESDIRGINGTFRIWQVFEKNNS